MEVARLDAGQVQGRPSGFRDSTPVPWTWTSRTRPVARPGRPAGASPAQQRSPRNVPVTTAPRPLTGRRGRSPGAPGTGLRGAPDADDPIAQSDERSPKAPTPGAVDGRDRRAPGTGSDARQAWLRPATTSAARSGATRSVLVTTPDRADSERVEELEVFERLGPGPVVGRHDEHRGVDLAGADQHVADEAVVPGHVDEVELAPSEAQVGVADVDRHPPAAAPRGAGRRRSPSTPGAAPSSRGRCGRRCR